MFLLSEWLRTTIKVTSILILKSMLMLMLMLMLTQNNLILAVHISFYSVSNDEPGMLPILGDIPSDLSADDVISDIAIPLISSVDAGIGGAIGLGVGAGTVIGAGVGVGGNGALNETPALGSTALVVEVLKELDKDYMALRSRLVNLLEQQAHSPPPPPPLPQSPSVASIESQTVSVESSGSVRENHSGDGSDGEQGEGVLDRDRKPSGGSPSIGDYTDTGTDTISRPHPIMNDEGAGAAHDAASSSSGSTVNHLDRLDKPRTVYWPSRQLVRT